MRKRWRTRENDFEEELLTKLNLSRKTKREKKNQK